MSKHQLPLDEIDVSLIQQFENLELLAKQVVEGFITGLHKSPFHGFSVEFAEHRLYNPGEPTKNIDWKLYARTDRLYTKRYEEETNLRCHVLLDNSSSMYFPDENYNKLQFSIYSTACLIYMLKKQRDAVGLSVFSDKIEDYFDARSSAAHHQLLFYTLGKMLKSNEKNKQTSTAEILHLMAERIKKRSLVIIFSDMFDQSDDDDALFDALKHLKYYQHEIILFHVSDKAKELAFEFEDRPYKFVDLESGEHMNLFPKQIKDKYTKYIQAYRKNLEVKCGQYNIEYVEADIQQGFRQILMPYFLKRMKMK